MKMSMFHIDTNNFLIIEVKKLETFDTKARQITSKRFLKIDLLETLKMLQFFEILLFCGINFAKILISK